MLRCGNRWTRTRRKKTMEITAVAKATEVTVTVTVTGINSAPLPTYLSQISPVVSRLQVEAIYMLSCVGCHT